MEDSKFSLLAEQFYEYLKVQGYSKRSIQSYRVYLNKFLGYLSGECDIASLPEITPDVIFSYQNALYYQKSRSGSPLSVLTQHNALSVVRTFFRFLLKTDRIVFDPASGLKLPKKEGKLPDVLSEKDVQKLLDQPDISTNLGFRDRCLMEVLYGTGIRNRELCQLDRYDASLTLETLLVVHGKGGKQRVLPLGEFALNYLSEYLLSIRPKLTRDESEQALFLTKSGRRFNPTDLGMTVRKYGERAGLKFRVTPHTLRHACATHMLRHGADIRHIGQLLGHASVTSTQVYTHVEISDLKAVHRRCHPRERDDAIG